MSTKPILPEELTIDAKPYGFTFPLRHTALLVIDMQRDFLLEGGFGEIQGGNLTDVQASIAPTKQLLDFCRGIGLQVFHTREGHLPDLSDCPSSKLERQVSAPDNTQHMLVIGDKGKMGRLLVRGEYGQDIVSELAPLRREVVVDKPGKGAFWNTSLMEKLKARAITHLIVSGVTTECCFATTIREGNDRGFECCGIVEATAGYNPSFKSCSLDMINWSQGLFGFVAHLSAVTSSLLPYISPSINPDKSSTPPRTPLEWDGDLSIAALSSAYANGLSPVTVIESLYKTINRYSIVDPSVWIHLVSLDTALSATRELISRFPDTSDLPPLFGIPFSVKDSIDVAGVPTTTACPALTTIPASSAVAFQRVTDAGAVFIGKTNLDQLATGLTGARSPYGIPRSVFSPAHISGGSSSGSAVSVGASLVSFSLATDTAGSGRVPASFNGVVGFKPTRGTVSFNGVTPACLSLDCVSFIARSISDARAVWLCCTEYDPSDRYAKRPQSLLSSTSWHINSLGSSATAFRFGIPPPEALVVCSPTFHSLFTRAVQTLQSIGGELIPLDWTPFDLAGKLLYDGTFVSERLASLPDGWFESHKSHLHPVISDIFQAVVDRKSTAVEAFRDLQAKELYTRQAQVSLSPGGAKGVPTFLVVPTAPSHPTLKTVLESPIKTNSLLGTFTHFGNVLDLNAAAVPAGLYRAEEEEKEPIMPFGVTILGAAGADGMVLEVARRFEEAACVGLGTRK